jgi:hypothetical protein
MVAAAERGNRSWGGRPDSKHTVGTPATRELFWLALSNTSVRASIVHTGAHEDECWAGRGDVGGGSAMPSPSLSARAVLVRIGVTTLGVAVLACAAAAVTAGILHTTGQVVSSATRKIETCQVMQSRPCIQLSPSVLAADTGLQLPEGTKVLEGSAGRYFPREEYFDLSAKISVPPDVTLDASAGPAVVRDLGMSAGGRHLYQISMRVP